MTSLRHDRNYSAYQTAAMRNFIFVFRSDNRFQKSYNTVEQKKFSSRNSLFSYTGRLVARKPRIMTNPLDRYMRQDCLIPVIPIPVLPIMAV